MIRKITVFGSSAPKPGEPDYETAYRLGRFIGTNRLTVLNGGYIGTMEAVSRGALEAGGHTIGVTCDEIESWRAVKPNQWIAEELRFPTLIERINALIRECDIAIALPGGPGTLAETTIMWNLLIIRAIPPKPFILIGESWEKAFQALSSSLSPYITENQMSLLTFAPNVDGAIDILNHQILKGK